MRHIEEIEARIGRFDARLLDGLKDYRNILALLQTLPGVDLIGAAKPSSAGFLAGTTMMKVICKCHKQVLLDLLSHRSRQILAVWRR